MHLQKEELGWSYSFSNSSIRKLLLGWVFFFILCWLCSCPRTVWHTSPQLRLPGESSFGTHVEEESAGPANQTVLQEDPGGVSSTHCWESWLLGQRDKLTWRCIMRQTSSDSKSFIYLRILLITPQNISHTFSLIWDIPLIENKILRKDEAHHAKTSKISIQQMKWCLPSNENGWWLFNYVNYHVLSSYQVFGASLCSLCIYSHLNLTANPDWVNILFLFILPMNKLSTERLTTCPGSHNTSMVEPGVEHCVCLT